ncbi:SDR family oxidoreductase [Kribbella sp. NPDC023972]|uniref:SDR family oxidoreductase n=1 Tax=Kribbella sp. NPDC023972 TaxID=3154795 RepID=UPI0033FFCB37
MAVVAITGASAGIGRACAQLFAERGYDVGLIARGPDGLAGAVTDVERAGSRAVAVPIDVSDANAVEKAAQSIEEELGPIDIWVNSAMATVYGPFLEISADEYQRVTEVTYLGFVNGTRAALHRMTPRDRGVIVQIGSALAYRGIPLQSAYCGAKHAIQGFTDSIRCELLHDRSAVRLVEVHMPAVNTPQFHVQRSKLRRKTQPVPPIYQPELAAEAVWHAAHHRRRQVWVGFPTVYTILGDRLAGPLLDSFLGRTGYDSQQLDEPRPADDPDNLYEPVPGDHGAHGAFDDKAKPHSRQLRFTLSRPVARLAEAIDAASAAAGRGLAYLAQRKQQRPKPTPSPSSSSSPSREDAPIPG